MNALACSSVAMAFHCFCSSRVSRYWVGPFAKSLCSLDSAANTAVAEQTENSTHATIRVFTESLLRGSDVRSTSVRRFVFRGEVADGRPQLREQRLARPRFQLRRR